MQKKVMLIFPPEWVPTAPYLALPSLTAVLRQNGIEVVQKDINVEAYDHYFTREFIEFTAGKIRSRYDQLCALEQTRSLSDEESQLKSHYYEFQFADLDDLIKNSAQAKEILRGPMFYDVVQAEWALNAFRDVTDFISIAYYPASIVFYPGESNLNLYHPWISKELLAAPDDNDVNIYADVCRQLVFPDIEKEKPPVIGISIGTPVQLMSGVTFCKLIKQKYPDIKIVVGGNIITRLKEEFPKHKRFFEEVFDYLVYYEGEQALTDLVMALSEGKSVAEVPNLIWFDKDKSEVIRNEQQHTERVMELPVPDFDGLPLEKYFAPELILPYLGTRGCYWGKCTFCDHHAGYIDQFRAKHADKIVEELQELKSKYDCRHFLFTDESFPPALFVKLPPLMIEAKLDIYWTTLIRFEQSLIEPELWDKAAESGCRSLYFGLESANQRIINLVKKDTKIDVAIKNLKEAKRVGIWSHVMGFFGFPSETQEEADDTQRFLIENRKLIPSVEMYFFVLYKHAPVWDMLEETKIKVHENPDHDLALDYYYTPEDGLTIPDAMQRYESFYRDDFDPWALRVNSREHVFLYITHFGTNDLPQIYVKNDPNRQEAPASFA